MLNHFFCFDSTVSDFKWHPEMRQRAIASKSQAVQIDTIEVAPTR